MPLPSTDWKVSIENVNPFESVLEQNIYAVSVLKNVTYDKKVDPIDTVRFKASFQELLSELENLPNWLCYLTTLANGLNSYFDFTTETDTIKLIDDSKISAIKNLQTAFK